ncbi:MAG: HAD family hydrolase [Clostridiales bacterium]|nr:HAD family hydrolase [Clostridiales bacterium]MCF8021852.1 HAD family hydrolase [Clostridiales bacterium]
MLKAALFDLDGTLLPIDTEKFMKEYTKKISSFMAQVVDPQLFTRALMASTQAMIENRDASAYNSDVFWAAFNSYLGKYIQDLEPLIEDFYKNEFHKLGNLAGHNKYSHLAVQTAVEKGYRIALATNSVFPTSAIHDRMTWAGVNDMPWELITSYENMHFCKPHPEYFTEITEQLEVLPRECIMIGNHAEEDLVPAKLGMKTCLVTDHLIGSPQEELQPDWSGTLADLIEMLKTTGD